MALIGITTGLITPRDGQPAVSLKAAYTQAVLDAGGAPVVLAPPLAGDSLDYALSRLDGLVITGGPDVDPARYGQQPNGTLMEHVSSARDDLELAAARYAIERGLPLLAICRGMQVLNVAMGGTLIQDIPSQVTQALSHAVPESREEPVHVVAVSEGSCLASVVSASALRVNSRHHQSVDALGTGLVATAWAPDGVIEAAEIPGQPVLAVQWHPEDMTLTDPAAAALFRWLRTSATK